jgi:hypothetical protein
MPPSTSYATWPPISPCFVRPFASPPRWLSRRGNASERGFSPCWQRGCITGIHYLEAVGCMPSTHDGRADQRGLPGAGRGGFPAIKSTGRRPVLPASGAVGRAGLIPVRFATSSAQLIYPKRGPHPRRCGSNWRGPDFIGPSPPQAPGRRRNTKLQMKMRRRTMRKPSHACAACSQKTSWMLLQRCMLISPAVEDSCKPPVGARRRRLSLVPRQIGRPKTLSCGRQPPHPPPFQLVLKVRQPNQTSSPPERRPHGVGGPLQA